MSKIEISNRNDCAHDIALQPTLQERNAALLARLQAEAQPKTKTDPSVAAIKLLRKIADDIEAYLAAPISNTQAILAAVETAVKDNAWTHTANLYRLHRGYQLDITPNAGGKPIIVWCSTKNAARAECAKHNAKAWNF